MRRARASFGLRNFLSGNKAGGVDWNLDCYRRALQLVRRGVIFPQDKNIMSSLVLREFLYQL